MATLGTAGLVGGRWALAGVVLAPVVAGVVWRIAWPVSFKQRVTPASCGGSVAGSGTGVAGIGG
ncbi:hypothetical protein [Actinocatenispora sera]|uniref:Uncharacterized protein n=1 Tax=Actinocatenispora sera TaxID=390989 RepID=A0A810L687_9ACTN|nr:hypothetical protein [Actinocatenispora sera]BCJ29618.1 hypothetical protein Asera_37260 [Actinocatenispora sera]